MKNENYHSGHAGDVQLFTVDCLPAEAKKISNKPIALGEKNNHAHIITGDCDLYENDDVLFVKTNSGRTLLQHTFANLITQDTYNSQEVVEIADHKPVELLPNRIYKIGIQRKYEPYKKIWQKVID